MVMEPTLFIYPLVALENKKFYGIEFLFYNHNPQWFLWHQEFYLKNEYLKNITTRMAGIQVQIYQFALALQTNHITYLYLSLLIYPTSMISALPTLMLFWGQNEIT